MQEFEVMGLERSDFHDDFGNEWTNVAFVGHSSEPIKWVLKEPSKVKVGDKVYGEIVTKTSKAGKPYLRFYKKDRPNDSFPKPSDHSDKYLKDLSDTPLRVFSASLPYVDTQGLLKGGKYLEEYLEYVETVSGALIGMMDRIRSGGKSSQTTPEDVKKTFPGGYDDYSDEAIREGFDQL